MVANLPLGALLGAGYALVPIPYRKKKPVLVGWQRRDQVVTLPTDLGLLSGMNVGLAHAYCGPAPTCALDIDNYPLAIEWLAKRGIDLRHLLEGANSVVIWSGKRHSLKILFRLPEGKPPMASTKVVHDKKITVLEFRCATKRGLTVQDVLPPSIHPNGTQYQWLGQGSPLNPPTIPDNLLTVWLALITKNRKPRSIPRVVARIETPRTIAHLQLMLSFITADCDYETWRNIVWAILSTGWNCAESVARDWSMSAPDRYEECAFWDLVNSYDPSYEPSVSLGSVYHHARLGGWHD